MRTRTLTRTITNYFENCEKCGREFQITKKKVNSSLCPKCQKASDQQAEQKAEQEAKNLVSFMVGARIVKIDISGSGRYADSSVIVSITIETENKKKIAFTPSTWGERFIEWETLT